MVETDGQVGGGSLPIRKLPGSGVALWHEQPRKLLTALRAGKPPVMALLREDRVLLDVRCVAELAELASAVTSAMPRAAGQEIDKIEPDGREV